MSWRAWTAPSSSKAPSNSSSSSRPRRAKLAIVTSNSSRTVRRWFAIHHLIPPARCDRLARQPAGAEAGAGNDFPRARSMCDTREGFSVCRRCGFRLPCRDATGSRVFWHRVQPGSARSARCRRRGTIFSSPAALGIHLNLVDSAVLVPVTMPRRDRLIDRDGITAVIASEAGISDRPGSLPLPVLPRI